MVRIKTGVTRRRKHQRLLRKTKGYRGARSRRFKTAKEAHIRALQYAYAHRRLKKRQFRSLWIVRLNAALKPYGLNYSAFIRGLKQRGIELNRKVLAHIAVSEPELFQQVVQTIQTSSSKV